MIMFMLLDFIPSNIRSGVERSEGTNHMHGEGKVYQDVKYMFHKKFNSF